MTIILSCSTDTAKSKLRSNIKSVSRPTDCRISPFLQSEMLGSIQEDSFWLQCTRPHFSSVPQRYFKGTLTPYENQTIISGRFKFTRFYKLSSFVLAMVLFAIGIIVHLKGGHLLFPLIFILPSLIAPCFSPIIFKKEEEAVKCFLQNLEL